MNFLNKSISPRGQQLFPTRGANSIECTQNHSQESCFRRCHSVKEAKSTMLKKSIIIAGDSPQRDSFKTSYFPAKRSGKNSLLASISGSILKIPKSLRNKDKCGLLMQPMTQNDGDDGVITFGPFLPNFLPSLMKNGKIDLMEDGTQDDGLSLGDLNDPALVVAVFSAVKLESTQMDQIAKKMQKLTGCTNLRLQNTVDPSLIAGFVISYERDGSHLIDLSVRGQLAELVATIESTDQRIASHSQVGGL